MLMEQDAAYEYDYRVLLNVAISSVSSLSSFSGMLSQCLEVPTSHFRNRLISLSLMEN